MNLALTYKREAIPVTGRGGLLGCEMLSIPQCSDNRLTGGGEVVSLRRRPRFTHRNLFCAHFC
jgi:hypothetical protein